MTVDDDLRALVAEGHAALKAPAVARVSEALTVLPRLVQALDRVYLYQHDMRVVRDDLKTAVITLRNEVWAAQKAHPDVTYRAGQIHKAMKDITELLDRLDRLIFNP